MNIFKTYISYVVQSEGNHRHEAEIADLKLPTYAFYSDNTSQEVLKWIEQKQQEFSTGERVIVLNYFNISNVK
jgi:hypothetical protein